MGLLKNIVKYGLFLGTLGFVSPLNHGENLNNYPSSKNFVTKADVAEAYLQKAIKRLPISEVDLVQRIDADKDKQEDYIVVGKLFDNHRDYNGKFVGKDKCGIFLLQNKGKKFESKTLEDKLNRHPKVLNSWMSTVNGKNIKLSIDNLVKGRKKLVLTLEADGKKHKVYLDSK